MTASNTPACLHHWMVEPPNGPTSLGTCKHCGTQRLFYNAAFPDELKPPLPHPKQSEPVAQPLAEAQAATTGKILVVDDEPPQQRLLRTLLESDGYMVMTAGSGDEALRVFTKLPADLVLLDLMMPGMPPRTFVSRIRAASSTPVLVLSGHPDAIEFGHLIGADDAIAKPFDPADLSTRVAQLLGSEPPSYPG